MNLVSLITFTAFIIYIFLAFFGLQMDSRSRLNRIFFCLCLACALWAFCIAFMFPATDNNTAWLWFRLSSPGWCLGPALVVHFALALTGRDQPGNKKLPIYLIYLPGLIFTVLGLTVGVTASHVALMSFGWSPVNSGNMVRYWAYATYYATCIALSIIVVWQWGKSSPSRRQQKQARIVVYSTFLGTLLAFFNETLLPVLGYVDTPKIPVVLWLIWAYGMWIAISRYRLLILTPAIAADQIVASITDMMVLLDLNAIILKVNRSIEEVLGYAEKELLGKPATHISETWDISKEALHSLVTGLASFHQQEASWVTKSGAAIPVQISGSAVKDNYGDLVCLVVVAQDLRPTKELEREISERRRAEQALQETVMQIKDYSIRLEEQNHKLEFQNAELEAMTTSLAEANQTLEEKNSQLENLFNNVGQGFLSFSQDLLIHPENSRECLAIFRQNPTGKRLSNLIYPQDKEQAEFMDTVFNEIMQESDPLRLEVFLSLLPEETSLHERCISIAYRVINNPGDSGRAILVILTDISEKRLLEARMQEEKDIFSMVVKAIIYHDDLLECIEDFRDFYNHKFKEILSSSRELDDILAEILRNLHTFKGNFSQFDTASVVGELHHLESLLLEARDQVTGFDREYLLQVIQQSQLIPCLENDLKVIINFLGNEFFERKDSFVISKEKLLALEQTIYNILPPSEYQLLLPLLRSLRYRPIKELLKSYPEYVQKMAHRLDKQIYPFVIEGDDLLVDSDYYHPFARSLVHVFRNCIDHGLENAETRVILGKDEIGSIRCSIQGEGDRILISISDDGSGIDFEALRQRAINTGLYPLEEANNCTEEQLLELIFYREFSTQTEVSLISGRGVGLSAVKTELENIGGKVTVTSRLGIGTEFLFDLPIVNTDSVLPRIEEEAILDAITASAGYFIADQTGIIFSQASDLQRKAQMVFDRLTAVIIIQGISSNIIALSYSDELLDALLQGFLIGDIAPEEKEALQADLLTEASNIIIGNSLKRLGTMENLITVSTPIVECSKTSVLKHSQSQILCRDLEEGLYTLTLSLVSMDDGLIEEGIARLQEL